MADRDGAEAKRRRMTDDSRALRRTAVSFDVVPRVACAHQGAVNAVSATRDARWLFTAGSEGVVRRYDVVDSYNASLAPAVRASASASLLRPGKLLHSWEAAEPAKASTAAGSQASARSAAQQPIYSLATHSEGLWTLTGHASGEIKLWSVRVFEGRCLHVFHQHKQAVSCLELSPDESALVSGSWDASLVHWDLHTGSIVRRFAIGKSQITAARFAGASSIAGPLPLLLSTAVNGDAHLWDVRQEAPARTLSQRGSWIVSACWATPPRLAIYCGRKNATVDEFDVTAGQLVQTLQMPSESRSVTHVAAFPDGKHLLVGSEDGVRVRALVDATALPKSVSPFMVVPAHPSGSVCASVIDPMMRFMVTATGDRGLLGATDRTCLIHQIAPTATT